MKKLTLYMMTVLVFGACKPDAFLSSDDTGGSASSDQPTIKLVPVDPDKGDYRLIAAAPVGTKSVRVCEINEGENCDPGLRDENGRDISFESNLIYISKEYYFFLPESSALLENGLTLTFVAFDANEGELAKRIVQFSGPEDVGGGSGSGGSSSSSAPANIKSIVQTSCGGAGCHDNYASRPESLRGTDTEQRLYSSDSRMQMPRGRQMSDADKQALIQFLRN